MSQDRNYLTTRHGSACTMSCSRRSTRGYFVSTVGQNEETIRTYIKNQEIADKAVESVATEARVLIKSHLLYQNPS